MKKDSWKHVVSKQSNFWFDLLLLLESETMQNYVSWSERKNREFKSTFEHIELAAKLLDYFLRRDKCMINQTGKSSLKPLLEGLSAQIHMDLSPRGFGRNRTRDLWVAHTSVKCRALLHWAKESLKIPSGPSSEHILIDIYFSQNRTGLGLWFPLYYSDSIIVWWL